ncbi:hypothetical protein COLO4_13180 [Corchorus olitorius]|uniref:Uncharacterized protein n=1 Tax=Corchorus olitorius TaxID=93759 RepID=A0A1R3JXT9_9ROSI|nr:hypothetical protein COLO4_13180 [Corchorus olitorius]
MASLSRATPRPSAPLPPDHHHRKHFLISAPNITIHQRGRTRSRTNLTVVRVVDGGDSYLDMWKKAVDRERKETEFQKLASNLASVSDDSVGGDGENNKEVIEKKSEEFQKILEVSNEERDRIQRMQVIDRAAAAIAAARSIFKKDSSSTGKEDSKNENGSTIKVQEEGKQSGSIFVTPSRSSGNGIPGPDFWSWAPPETTDQASDDMDGLQTARKASEYTISSNPVLEKDRSVSILSIPFESKTFETIRNLPPFQSLIEVDKTTVSEVAVEETSLKEEHDIEVEFSAHAAEAADALHNAKELSPEGVSANGTRWWKETGIEQRPDGVICRWTIIRGVSADQSVEWQEKFWEASDEFDYKELGSEKSGRDAFGNVWSEYWRESMLQSGGLVHLEKTADKWGKNAKGEEWQEKWWEHYDASGKSEKWADKWCSIDPNTPLEDGHAHVWHERWGEQYDGYGGSVKYTDKWAERCEGDGWAKWGDKWDEHFDSNGHGVKQGETWWQGKYGDRWNRTWGEHHNGSGWVHKYGQSSSGEHWDTHVGQETWYERFPHYGFYHCFENSVQLREVKKPSEMSDSEQ